MKQKRRHDRGGGQSEGWIGVLSRLIGESLGVLGLFDERDWLPGCDCGLIACLCGRG